MSKFNRQALSRCWRFRPWHITARLFHRDQRGLEALQVVMILAVAAVCLQAIKYWWPWWREFFNLAISIFLE